jgi:hypothetical protein
MQTERHDRTHLNGSTMPTRDMSSDKSSGIADDELWGVSAVVKKTGLSRSTLYAYVSIGLFRSSGASALDASHGWRQRCVPGSTADRNNADESADRFDGMQRTTMASQGFERLQVEVVAAKLVNRPKSLADVLIAMPNA